MTGMGGWYEDWYGEEFGQTLGPTTTATPGTATATPAGKYSASVAAAQRALVTLGYSVGRSGVDGIWGPDTAAAVRSFQFQTGRSPTGQLDAATMAALEIAAAAKAVQPTVVEDVGGEAVGITVPPARFGSLVWVGALAGAVVLVWWATK